MGSPTFSSDNVTVVFVLGGPGSGKGTQSAMLVEHYGFKHLSAGDLLREEQNRPGSSTGEMIKEYIREGKIVPKEVTIKLLQDAMLEDIKLGNPMKRFLIDGFPRKQDQAEQFEADVCVSKFTLFFDCPEDVLKKRLLERGETSGRSDDNMDSIMKRFKVFVDQSMPVIDKFGEQGKVEKVSAAQTREEVYQDVVKAMTRRGLHQREKSP